MKLKMIENLYYWLPEKNKIILIEDEKEYVFPKNIAQEVLNKGYGYCVIKSQDFTK